MADINKLIPKILIHEGGFCDVKDDKGGATNKGVTIAVWRAEGRDIDKDGDIDVEDLKVITIDDFKVIFKKFYWDKFQADKINNQSIADILVDWIYNSGGIAIRKLQRILEITEDGVVGPKTIITLNAADQKTLFSSIWAARFMFYNNIVKNNPSQQKFLKGWINRLNSYSFEP